MRALFIIASGLMVAAVTPVYAGGGGEAAELEHARANARAGGPVSERDVELLQRWGCTSGTNHPVCGSNRYERRTYTHKPRQHRRRWVD